MRIIAEPPSGYLLICWECDAVVETVIELDKQRSLFGVKHRLCKKCLEDAIVLLDRRENR